MDRRRREFSLYKRPALRGKPTYYAKIRDDSGVYSRRVSTGQTTKIAAEQWVRAMLDREAKEAEARSRAEQRLTVSELASGFWAHDGEYATSRRIRGYSVSNGHLDISEGYTRNHIVPAWGDTAACDITPGAVDRWVIDLHRSDELAPATINKLLQTLRSILEGAVSRGVLSVNPAASIKPIRAQHRQRGVLTDDEVRTLLKWPGPFDDYRQFAINVVAFATGARMGEIRGLCIDSVHPDRVEIRRSWEEGHGLKPPKFDGYRVVPIAPRVWDVISRVIEETQPESLIFYGTARKSSPMSKSHIEKSLHRAIVRALTPEGTPDGDLASVQAMISTGVRDRYIGVHSWRHKLNTVLRSHGVPDSKIRALTGHRGESMTDWYTKFSADDYHDVTAIQTALLPASPDAYAPESIPEEASPC